MQASILIVEEEEKFNKLLPGIIRSAGYPALTAHTAKAALKILRDEIVYVVIIHTDLPDSSGIDLISDIKDIHSYIEVISLADHPTVQDGIRSIRNGAFDYIPEDDRSEQIAPIVTKAYAKADMQYHLAHKSDIDFKHILGNSPSIVQAKQLALKVAPTDTNVLLLGETGTGKEVFAQAIHNSSNRKPKPFLAINCSSFSEELLESELFGHVSGAFTGSNKDKKGMFEAADGGTLFLDEIGEMKLKLQAKLLRVLENGTFNKVGDERLTRVNTRIIAATNRDLKSEAEKNMFRWDLYYRLAVFTIQLPPLRGRRDDIKLLANYFITEYSYRYKKEIDNIDPNFLNLLTQYPWKGNIRELKNVISRVIILANNKTLTADLLPPEFFEKADIDMNQILNLSQIESQAIRRALMQSKGNKSIAARLLGIGLSTLYRKIEEYQVKGY